MTKSIIIYFIFLSVFLYGSVFAGGLAKVELIDGSMISGEIVSFRKGVYTLRSGILGTIKINESKIRLIRMKSFDATAGKSISPSNTSSNEEVQTLQQSILGDQKIMELILSLQSDPDVQELLQDPVIMNAVNSGDFTTLMSSPKFIKILEKTTIQEIKKEVTK